jgi:YihY family inner membrane protein
VLGAELGRALLGVQLARQPQPLIARQRAREVGDAGKLLAQQRGPLNVRAQIDQAAPRALFAAVAKDDRHRSRRSRLDRAATGERAVTVIDARAQALRESVSDVTRAGEGVGPARASEQLDRRLAVAVFEFLAPQAVAVQGEQLLAPLQGDKRHRLQRVEQPEAARPAIVGAPPRPWVRYGGSGEPGVGLCERASGRHASMSVRVAGRPPSQSDDSAPGGDEQASAGGGPASAGSARAPRDSGGSLGERAGAALRRFDAYQHRSRRLGFVVAVLKRYGEDEAGSLGALIAYYGFFSLFPLLLVFVTVLGFVLEGNPKAQEEVLHSTVSQFPVIGAQIRSNIGSLKGSAIALTIGIVGSLLAGLAVTGATQHAFNKIWRIPRQRRLGFLGWRLRGLALLAVLGVLSIVSTVAAGYATAQTRGAPAVLLGVAIALLANLLLFSTVFRLMTSKQIATSDLVPGIVLAAVLWQILQHVGGLYIEHIVRHAQETAGVFAFVLGLLSWLYLGGQVVVLSAEVNVVRARRLWPRRLFEGP